jgi:hypothetical protein
MRVNLNLAQRATVCAALVGSVLAGAIPPWIWHYRNENDFNAAQSRESARRFILRPPENRVRGTPGPPYELDFPRIVAEQGLILIWCVLGVIAMSTRTNEPRAPD